MIPKIIHCFWAGGPKTKLAERCLASWRKLAPDYEIREWNLSNIAELASPPAFFRSAVAGRRWAFAADWARFAVLKKYGGIYLDMDVELIRPIRELPKGEWVSGEWQASGRVIMNPGSGIALEEGSPCARAMLDYYETHAFCDRRTVGDIQEEQLAQGGLALRVLEPEVMSPIGIDGKLHRTEKTVGIHWYAMSWASPSRRLAKWLSWHGLRPVVDFMLKLRK